jgi:hypothetical protein
MPMVGHLRPRGPGVLELLLGDGPGGPILNSFQWFQSKAAVLVGLVIRGVAKGRTVVVELDLANDGAGGVHLKEPRARAPLVVLVTSRLLPVAPEVARGHERSAFHGKTDNAAVRTLVPMVGLPAMMF